MNKMARAFEKSGYQTINQSYASRSASIETLSKIAIPAALESLRHNVARSGKAQQPDYRVHFVTHSMGGILLRCFLAENRIDNIGQTVMIAPPNQGSEVVDTMRNVPGFKLLNGPAGMQLGTDANSVPLALGPVDFPTGIIAGTRSINPILSLSLPKPNDGKVSVINTRVEGMADFIQYPLNHTFIMQNKEVIRQTINFINSGAFEHIEYVR